MGRHGDAEGSTLPASVGAQSPHLHLAGTVPRGKAQSGTSRARACLGLTGPCSVTQAAPPSSAPARVVGVGHKQEVGGCALSDKHQGRQAPSSAQSAGAAHGQRTPGACEHPLVTETVENPPRTRARRSQLPPAEGPGSSIDSQRSRPHAQAHVTSSPSRQSRLTKGRQQTRRLCGGHF